ncbi:MAG: HD domain-containing phosphohydrolase [Thermoguttaceae bacterium]|jgi:putative two-component system response regulator
MRVLVADDDEFSREMICHLLEGEGYEVASAADGQQALERIRQQDIRLVISDWEMPQRSGVELCRAIRDEDLASYVYVILVTCRGSSAEIVEGMEAGADDFIPKPFHAAELLARLRAGERLLSLETREMTIFALAKLTESRDPETGYHLERVQNYSRVLAQQLAAVAEFGQLVDPEFVRLIYLTSPLHDIGKVGIPDRVLLKPDRLSDEEFAIMKTHAQLGARTLEQALNRYPGARFLEIARDIAATHHERYDGKGYPAGLTGEAIPLAGRIVAVADVYDALTSKRIYKAAMEHSVATSIIVKESGRQFDPAVVQAFLAAEDQFLQIRARFADVADALADEAKKK